MLDHEGHLVEQGNFDELSSTSGYVSSFALGFPGLDCKPLKPVAFESPRVRPDLAEKPMDTKEEPEGTGGDITIYLYYIRSIGWFSTFVFVTAISGFVFCISFPSMLLSAFLGIYFC